MFRESKISKPLINDPNYRLENTPNITTIDDILEMIHKKDSIINEMKDKMSQNSNSSYERMLFEDNNSYEMNKNMKSKHKTQNNLKRKSFSPKLSQNSYKSLQKNNKKSKVRELSPQVIKDNNRMENTNKSLSLTTDEDQRVFQVLWGKYKPNKKHKQWNGDGFLFVSRDKSVRLCDINGKSMGTAKGLKSNEDYEEGKRLVVGANEVQICDEVSLQELKSGMFFIDNSID